MGSLIINIVSPTEADAKIVQTQTFLDIGLATASLDSGTEPVLLI